MKTVAIIQARAGGTRLPGKVLKEINGKTMLERVIERVQKSNVDETVLAIPHGRKNDLLKRYGPFYAGSETDLLARFYGAAQEFKADIIVRVTADCPLVDPETINRVLSVRADYVWAQDVIGLDVEAFTIDALRRAYLKANKPHEREHVTPYFYEGHGFNVMCCSDPTLWRTYRLCVDEEDDLEMVRRIYSKLGDFCTTQEVIALLDANSEIAAINAHVKQKEVEG